MPEYLAPGVYVEEIEIGGKPIEGVSTSTVGFLGETERGPERPKLVTGFEEFKRLYGGSSWTLENGQSSSSYLPYAIDGFFSNGGKRCFIYRTIGSDAKTAGIELNPQAGLPTGTPSAATGSTPTPAATETGTGGKVAGKNPATPTPKMIAINALGEGIWGTRVAIKIEPGSLATANPKLFKLVVIYWREAPPLPLVDPTDPAKLREANRREPTLLEDYDNLSPDERSSDFFVKRINGMSSLIEVDPKTVISGVRPDNVTLKFLEKGADGAKAVGLAEYEAGLVAFEAVDEISIVCAPNENDISPGVSDALIEHCELLRDRFAILQAKQGVGDVAQLRYPGDSKYAAFYYPWIKIVDPVSGMQKLVPPGGHVAGIYARSDIERGVHKAPANEVVRGAVDLEVALSKGNQDILNPRGVNCIRAFPGRGIRVWGARTISSDPLWKYVNVRRLMLFIEESIDEGTQWVVFEPNDQRLWARVRQSVSDFLTRVWKDGALMGTTPEQAFWVKCDETTMTPNDIETGKLICLIGVAPVRPAEFVIFRIAQWRSGSAITE